MAKNDNLKDFLTDVADAIREKKGTTDLINPQDFSAEIASIKSGGGAVAVSAKAVNFRDYDGTILHSYTKDEFLALSELPPLPTREGLICQEWNWDFADAVEYVTNYGVLEVGATYITDDGKTRLYITIATEGRMDVPLYFNQSVANGVTIDWGDGSATETISGTGNVNTTHHYNAIGDYVISLEVADGCALAFGGASGYCVLGSTTDKGGVYRGMLKNVEMGNGITELKNSPFYYCSSLSSITIPKEVVSIGSYAFYYCYSLQSVTIPKEVALINTEFLHSGYTIISISIPKKVNAIGQSAFQYCKSLQRLVFPTELTKLNATIFSNCDIFSVLVFPKGLQSIAANVFYNCYGMKYYDFSALESVPSLAATSAFQNIPSDCKILVPDALFDEWIAATNWSTYASKIIKKSEWDALNA